MKESNIINTRTSEIWMDKEGIIWGKIVLPNATFTLADFKENHAFIKEILQGGSAPIIADIRIANVVDGKIRKYAATHEVSRNTAALAIIVKSTATAIIANSFMVFSNPPYPTRMFVSIPEAVEWARQYLE